jgi:hypothetical protein
MNAKIIGASRAGEYGIKVVGKRAVLVQNRGGQGRGFLEEGSIEERGASGHAAYLALAKRLNWDAAAAETLWQAHA